MKTTSKQWRCPKCGRDYKTPLPASYVECKGMKDNATAHSGVAMKPIMEVSN